METLAVKQNNLPAMPTEDVKQYVDVIGDAIIDMKAKLSAAKHLRWESTTIEQMTAQINEYSAMRIQAQIELGKRTAEMEIKQGARNDLVQGSDEVKASKTEQLSEMGLPKQRANEYERMARHEDVVNRYIDQQIGRGETPTKAGALQAIADSIPKPKTAKQMAEENIEKINSSPVVSIKSAELLREERAVVDQENAKAVSKEITRASTILYFYCSEAMKKTDFDSFVRTADEDWKKSTVVVLNHICSCAMKLRDQIEVTL